jgi:hypothetical protein
MNEITNEYQSVSFGSFNPQEIERSRWSSVKYSISKITPTNMVVPRGQVLNRANVVASPEHLHTPVPHEHFGFSVYSGGTPTNDFMSDNNVPACTNLNERTPPVPMSQDLEFRGGLVKTATKISSINPVDLPGSDGFIANLEDDISSIAVGGPLTIASPIGDITNAVNSVLTNYDKHLFRPRTHVTNDKNDVVSLPEAVDLNSSILVMNQIKNNFNLHLVAPSVHTTNDTINAVVSPDATDLASVVTLTNEALTKFNTHRTQPGVHGAVVLIRINAPSGVLYEHMKFYTEISGVPNQIAPFADNIAAMYIDGVPQPLP